MIRAVLRIARGMLRIVRWVLRAVGGCCGVLRLRCVLWGGGKLGGGLLRVNQLLVHFDVRANGGDIEWV